MVRANSRSPVHRNHRRRRQIHRHIGPVCHPSFERKDPLRLISSIDLHFNHTIKHAIAGGRRDTAITKRYGLDHRVRERRLWIRKMKERGKRRHEFGRNKDKDKRNKKRKGNGKWKQNGRWKSNCKKHSKGRARKSGRAKRKADAGTIARHSIRNLSVHYNSNTGADKYCFGQSSRYKQDARDRLRQLIGFLDEYSLGGYMDHPAFGPYDSLVLVSSTQLFSTLLGSLTCYYDGEVIEQWGTNRILAWGERHEMFEFKEMCEAIRKKKGLDI